jgi:type II secretory pathway pseudopilin PulG
MSRLAGIGRLLRGRLAGERGFTLIELLVAMVGALVVAGAAMAFLMTSVDQQNAASSRTAATSQAESGLEQMVRDLRNAMYETSTNATAGYAVTVSTNATADTTSLSFDIPTSTSSGETTASDGTGVPVVWTCPSAAEAASYIGSCTRSVNGGSARTLINGVQSVTFTPYNSSGTSLGALTGTTTTSDTDPSSVNITLDVQDVSQLDNTASHTVKGVVNPIVIQTAADLRNFP